ncbi:MAG: hypothetical protein IKZ46_07680 [Victivallales bacterium]|nr:hypothetical protein [Victivallales bacterium]
MGTTKGTKEHENQTTEYTENTEKASPPSPCLPKRLYLLSAFSSVKTAGLRRLGGSNGASRGKRNAIMSIKGINIGKEEKGKRK